MPYITGERCQTLLFPPSLEDSVLPGDPVRAYDAFIEHLNLEGLGICWDPNQVGHPEYDPRSMLKLLVFGYSYGLRSSRKLERATYHNLSFMWLLGGLKPDHKTIANFRRQNKGALKKILKQCARLCIKLRLIDGNTLFVDGTKIRANASVKNSWTEKKCAEALKKIDERIEAILAECDVQDDQENDSDSLVKMDDQLKDQKTLKKKVQDILKELQAEDKKSINTTDPDCTRTNSLQGSHAGYNVQFVSDEKHGLLVHSDVVGENNDLKQFANQIDQANETLEKKCQAACADSGYASTTELEKIDQQNITVVVPSQRQASEREAGPFDKEKFKYDAAADNYLCPAGHVLNYVRTNTDNQKIYEIHSVSVCRSCPHFGVCTKSLRGRSIHRLINEEIRQKLEKQYEQPESQAIYKLRQQKAELPFGHIKRNLKVDAFLLRGQEGVRAEASILATCFNLARMITLMGVPSLIRAMAA